MITVDPLGVGAQGNVEQAPSFYAHLATLWTHLYPFCEQERKLSNKPCLHLCFGESSWIEENKVPEYH